MKRKKAISLFLAALMTAAACLGGCGSSAGTASEAVTAEAVSYTHLRKEIQGQ